MPSRPALRFSRSRPVRTLTGLLLVLVLAVGAFVGYGAYTRSKPTTYARGGVPFAAAADDGAVPPRATSPTPTPTVAEAAAPAAARKRPLPGPSAEPLPVATRLPQAAAVARPRLGAYGLHAEGRESVRFGPVSFCSRQLPDHPSLVVSRARGEAGDAYVFDLRLFPDDADAHDERHVYRYAGQRVLLTFEQATVTCAGVKQSSAVSYARPQLRVDAEALRVGSQWSTRGGDADRTELSRSTVIAHQQVNIGGQAYPVWVIDTHTDISGAESGDRDQRWWWSPDLAAPLRWTDRISASRSGATYSNDLTVSMTRVP